MYFLTHVALPRHPTQSPLPALPTADYNLHGRAPTRLHASDNMCVGETVRLAERVKGKNMALEVGTAPSLKPIKQDIEAGVVS